MTSRKAAQYGYPSMERKPHSPVSAGSANPIIRVSVSGGVIYNGLEAFWIKQVCESKEAGNHLSCSP